MTSLLYSPGKSRKKLKKQLKFLLLKKGKLCIAYKKKYGLPGSAWEYQKNAVPPRLQTQIDHLEHLLENK